MPLVWVLREELGLTGTKFGCGMAQCGACTVQVDGIAVRSCVLPLGDVGKAKVTTIEQDSPSIKKLQRAWTKYQVPQCGYCQPGQIMAADALLKAKPNPDSKDIDVAMSGNLCRCGTYPRIKKAILSIGGD